MNRSCDYLQSLLLFWMDYVFQVAAFDVDVKLHIIDAIPDTVLGLQLTAILILDNCVSY